MTYVIVEPCIGEKNASCGVTLCQRPDHLELVTKATNVKRRGSTRGPNKRGDA